MTQADVGHIPHGLTYPEAQALGVQHDGEDAPDPDTFKVAEEQSTPENLVDAADTFDGWAAVGYGVPAGEGAEGVTGDEYEAPEEDSEPEVAQSAEEVEDSPAAGSWSFSDSDTAPSSDHDTSEAS